MKARQVLNVPSLDLLVRVCNVGDRLTSLVVLSHLSKVLSAGTVDRVTESRVVTLEVGTSVQCAVRNGIKLGDVSREPWHTSVIKYQHVLADLFEAGHEGIDLGLSDTSIKVNVDAKRVAASRVWP